MLKFELPDSSTDPEIFIDALYESGCSDAKVGIGKQGHIALIFTREAVSEAAAVSRAIMDVLVAIPEAKPVQHVRDFLG